MFWIWIACPQTVKCGDNFQAEDGPRDFGNISIVTKWVKTTDTSLLLRSLDVGYKEVSFILFYMYIFKLSEALSMMVYGSFKQSENEIMSVFFCYCAEIESCKKPNCTLFISLTVFSLG
jgi:hypothetical protein